MLQFQIRTWNFSFSESGFNYLLLKQRISLRFTVNTKPALKIKRHLRLRYLKSCLKYRGYINSWAVDPNSLNPDPAFKVNPDLDTDPGFQWQKLKEKIRIWSKISIYFCPVLRIHDILGWIRIRISGSMPLTNGSGSGSWIRILLFSSLTFKMPVKNKFFNTIFSAY